MNKTLITAIATGAILTGTALFGAGQQTVHADSTESFSMKAVNFTHYDRVIIKYNSQGAAWTKPYGDSGAEYVMPLKNLRYFMVNVISERIDQDNGTRWLEVNIDNINGGKAFWIDASETNFKDTNNYFTQITQNDLKITTSTNGFFLTKPWGVKNAVVLGELSNYNGVTIPKGSKVITDKNGTQWLQATINGQTGWLDVNALSGNKTLLVQLTNYNNTTQSQNNSTAYNRYGVKLTN